MGKAHILGELGAGGGEVEDGVQIGLGQLLPDQVDHIAEALGLHGVFALVVPDVDVDDGGAGLHDGHSVGGDLLGCDGHIGRLGFHGARPAECRGDDEFFAHTGIDLLSRVGCTVWDCGEWQKAITQRAPSLSGSRPPSGTRPPHTGAWRRWRAVRGRSSRTRWDRWCA